MISKWAEHRLGELIREVRLRNENGEKLPVLSVTNTNGFVESKEFFERQVYSKDLSNYKIVNRNQFAYNPSRINVGSLARLKNQSSGLLSPMYVVFEAKEDADPDFLDQWFSSEKFRNLVNASTQGTVRDSLNYVSLAAMRIKLPPLPEQCRIAAILNSMDRVMGNSEKVAEQLRILQVSLREEMITQHATCLATAKHHGTLPTHWDVLRVKELLREPIRNGYSPNCPDYLTGAWILGLNAVTFQGYNPSGIKPAPSNDPRLAECVLVAGDLLISRSNTRDRVGLAGIYSGVPPNCFYPDLLVRIRVQDSVILPEWLEQWFLSRFGRVYFEIHARGTSGSMVKINKKIVEDFLVAVPPVSEQKMILNYINGLNRRIQKEVDLLISLKEIKRRLSQTLFSQGSRIE